MTFNEQVLQAFKGHDYQYNITIADGKPYFRYDTDDSTSKENFSTFCDIQQDLAEFGYTIDDVCIEHDCITGFIVELVK